jgi:hypothetical protein
VRRKKIAPLNPIDQAREKSAAVYGLFQNAKDNLDGANGILDSHVEITTALVKDLSAEISTAEEDRKRNAALSAKLAEFLP